MRRLLPLAAGLLLAGCGGSTGTHSASAPTTTLPQRTFAGIEMTPPRVAPPISLHDANGRSVTLASQRGRYVLITFLYTHCPDVCPLIAANLNEGLRLIGAREHKVSVFAVSVDPKGDTASAVRSYVKRKHLVPQFRYLIGTPAQLRPVWAAYNVLAVSRKTDLVDHVAYTALVDPSGKERVIYDARIRAQQVVHDLRVLMRAHGAA